MTKYIFATTPIFNKKVLVNGRDVAGLTDILLSAYLFGGNPHPIVSANSIINVKGSLDGANSIVNYSHTDEPRTVRVRETPEQLRQAFIEAGTRLPPIERTRFDRLFETMTGRPYYEPVGP